MESFAVYGHALAALAGLAVFAQILAMYEGFRKEGSGLAKGDVPKADYADPAYRTSRAYLSLIENSVGFIAAVTAAILSGANPFWVNLLASSFLLLRVMLAVVHIKGIGKLNGGPRSILFMLGWLCVFGLAGMAIWEAFS